MSDTVTLTVSAMKRDILLQETEGWVGQLLSEMKGDPTLDHWAEVECLNDVREVLGGRRIEEQGPLTRVEFEGAYVSDHEEIPY